MKLRETKYTKNYLLYIDIQKVYKFTFTIIYSIDLITSFKIPQRLPATCQLVKVSLMLFG